MSISLQYTENVGAPAFIAQADCVLCKQGDSAESVMATVDKDVITVGDLSTLLQNTDGETLSFNLHQLLSHYFHPVTAGMPKPPHDDLGSPDQVSA